MMNQQDFVFYTCTPEETNPLRVFGLPPYQDGEGFSKCHRSILQKIPSIAGLGHRSCGGRVCFRTNAPFFTLRMTLERVGIDIGIPIYGASSANVYVGERPSASYLGLLNPTSYTDQPVTIEKTFHKAGTMEDVTVILPRNETVTAFSVGLPAEASLEQPTPYRNHRPVVFYGSSITEGGCPTRVGCNYVSLLSMRANLDVLNFGFSGNAHGDLQFADYIIHTNPLVFVYDYDHNAPTPEFLEQTHEPFFRKIRAALPDLPILMMSRPEFLCDEDGEKRRAIIRRTYNHAAAAGDTLVRFIDGSTFFPQDRRRDCTTDTIHPNDTGFAYMADAILPVLSELIGIAEQQS